MSKYSVNTTMKVHILDSFPGSSKGKTKELPKETAEELIALGQAVSAEDDSDHPEATETGKPGANRKTKTDKLAEGADNK